MAACGSTTIDEYEVCTLDVSFEPAAGAPGTEIAVTGSNFSEVRDTRVEVGGVRATVTSVFRDDACWDCDSCRLQGGCAPCGLCEGLGFETNDEREACLGNPLADPPTEGTCAGCTESMVFVVPEVAPGLTAVLIVNKNGQSEAVPFEVLPGPDTTGNTGTTADTATASEAPDTSDTAVETPAVP